MFQNFILEPFLQTLANHEGRNALCIDGTFYTYADFARAVSKIRIALSGQSGHQAVALVANDDIETYASIFACWLEGLAYVPLLAGQPSERSQEIISQVGIDMVLMSKPDATFPNQKNLLTSELVFTTPALQPTEVSGDVLAYILFTSGSTGKPKGVPIRRDSLGAFMKSFWEAGVSVSEQDRCLQSFELTFDISVQSYLVPLLKGGCLYTIPHNQIKYSYIFGLLEDHELTFGAMAPSMIRYLRPYFDEIHVPSLRYCVLCAEASTADLTMEWRPCIPNARIIDFYGPTEATIYCTYYEVPEDARIKQQNGLLSIGRPMNGITAVIVGDDKEILGPGQQGELCVAGVQITDGYWQNPEKNAEAFLELDYNGTPTRFYRTGDSCHIDADGDIMYAGRLDYQVKIQGYRVELGEIEFHAREFLTGQNAVCVPVENASMNTEIVMFVEGDLKSEGELRAYLKAKLPAYMMPSKILAKAIFPINTNGKVDRKTLKLTLTETNTTNG